jgi:hypothetical protein
MTQPFDAVGDEDAKLTLQEYEAEITKGIRPGYRRRRTRTWNRWECLHWLFNVGYMDCSFNYCDTAGLIEEVLLQKAAMGV